MAVSPLAIRAIKNTYSLPVLEGKREELAAEYLSGVTITQVTFEGGGASGQKSNQSPTDLLEIVEAAINLWNDPCYFDRPTASTIDLSYRRFGT